MRAVRGLREVGPRFSVAPSCIARALDGATPVSWLGEAVVHSLPLALAVALNPAVTQRILGRIAARWPAAHGLVVRRRPRWRLLAQLVAIHPAAFLGSAWAEACVRDERALPARLLRTLVARDDAPAWLVPALASHRLPSLRAIVAALEDPPPALLAELAHDPCGAVREVVARNAAVARGDLERLAADPEDRVRVAVACRADAPAVLPVYGDTYLWVIAAERTMDPVTIEGLARHERSWVRRGAAANPAAPPAVLRALADDPDVYVRSAVARNPSTPAAALERLLELEAGLHSYDSVHSLAISNPNASPAMYERLAASRDGNMRMLVARSPRAPLALLVRLATDPHHMVAWVVAYNHGGDPGLAGALASHRDGRIRVLLAERTRDPAVLAGLAHDGDADVRVAVAGSEHATPWLLVTLARDPAVSVRRRVARNPATLPEDLERLAGDDDSSVRSMARYHDRVPLRFVLGEAQRPGATAYDEQRLARRLADPTTPPAVFVEALDRGHPRIAAIVAACAHLPAGLADRVERSPVAAVRAVLARTTSDPERLGRLALDPDPEVRIAVAARAPGNHAAPLVRDPDARVRASLARATRDPAIAIGLVDDASANVRAALAANPDAPDDVCELLALDPDEHVLAALLAARIDAASALLRLRVAHA